jgi:hypothetical protein
MEEGVVREEGAVRRRERRLFCRKSEKAPGMRSQGGFAHFAGAVAAAAGAGTIPFLPSFCASGLLWGIRWSLTTCPSQLSPPIAICIRI